jgi:SulP family sulfate permease
VTERSIWWGSFLQRHGIARGDLAGGLTAALVLPAIEGSYGLVAFAPLGPDHASIGFLLGAYTAAVASLVSLLAGGRGPLLSGSSAALALLLGSLFSWLLTDPRFLGAGGRPQVPLLMAFAALGLLLAGVMQAVVARLKLGGLVRFVPYPVHAGYMNGTAVLMLGAMWVHVVGLPTGANPFDWELTQPLAPVIALVALWIAVYPPVWTRRVPPYLTGLLVATALHHLLVLTPLVGTLGPFFNPPEFHLPGVDVIAPLAEHLADGLLLDKLGVLLLFAAAVAMMSSLQTALAGSTVDELTHKRRDGERELLAQGVANVAVGIIGAVPSAGSTMRSKINVDAGGKTGASRLVFGVALLLALAFGLQFMSLVPMAAIAGVFLAIAYSLVDDWTRRATAVLWRQTIKRRVPVALASSYIVMLIVAGVTVFVSLALAIALGTLIAMVLFIRSNCKQPIRQVVHADRRRSRKVRPAAESELLHRYGRRIALVELDGALFFGTAEEADDEISRLTHESEFIVLDFERVTEVDASGARVLLHAAESVARSGKHLLLSGFSKQDSRTRIIRDMDVHDRLSDGQFFPDADRALEHAEDRLLASLTAVAARDEPLRLEQTLLGAGLSVDEIALLASLMTERRIGKGEAVFRRGDPGDSMCVSLQGQIGIWLPAEHEGGTGWGRRMVSFAPGVVFGEIGLLQKQARSADAIAEDDALVLELPRANYEKLAADHPALLGKILLNLGQLLASRVRALTDELEAAHSAR